MRSDVPERFTRTEENPEEEALQEEVEMPGNCDIGL